METLKIIIIIIIKTCRVIKNVASQILKELQKNYKINNAVIFVKYSATSYTLGIKEW